MFNNTHYNCMITRKLFHEPGTDKLLLFILYGISAIITVAVNILLIRTLLNGRKSMQNNLFVILCISDVCVGSITLPLTMVLFTKINENIYCILYPIIIFFFWVPTTFSWNMTIIIAIDRYLIITKPALHSKYMTSKVLCFSIFISFLSSVLFAFWYIFTKKTSGHLAENNNCVTVFESMELCEILIVTALYTHLVMFVHKEAKKMADSRHVNNKRKHFSVRMAKTIALILLCLALCNVSQLIGTMYVKHSGNRNAVVVRSVTFSAHLIVSLNSFFNAVILMTRSRKLQENSRRVRKITGSIK